MSFSTLQIQDFSRGLDLVSNLPTLQPGSTPNAKNFRILSSGGVDKILGYAAWGDLGTGNQAHDLFWYRQADASPNVLIAATATKWYSVSSSGTPTAIRTSLTTTTDTSFVAHDDVLYGCDGVNIMGSWTGSGSASTHAVGVDTGPPLGIILGIWQQRMYVAPVANPMRVVFSEPGNFTSAGAWPAGNVVDLAAPSTSDKIIGGMPTSEGLLVFAQRATFLIYGSLDGDDRLVDPERGLASRRSLAVIDGHVYGVNGDGVFQTTGAFPLQMTTRAIEPLFAETPANLTVAAGVRYRQTLLLSYDRSGNAANDLTLDYRPSSDQSVAGSWMANDYPMRAAVTAEFSADEELYFVDASDPTKIRKGFSGGTFAGTAISCFYDLPPDDFGIEQQLKRLHRIRIVGRGSLYVAARTDYGDFDVDALPLEFPSIGSALWDGVGVNWDSAEWGGYALFEGHARVRAFGRRIQLRLYETSSGTYPARTPLNAATGDSIGACGAYMIEASFTVSSRHR